MTQRLSCVHLLVGLLTWLSLGVTSSAMATENPANPLITDRGKFRPLILVAPSLDDADYLRMRSRLDERQAAFAERKMVLYSVAGTREGNSGQRAGQPMTEFENRALLEALEVDTQGPLTVILVGMDGGKKMQLEGYVAPQSIFDIIDNMPIRQSEGGH